MRRAGGAEYLGLVTDLLQRARLADPVAGLWEAADLQWWFTRDPHPDDRDAAFWPDPRTGVGLVEPMRVEDAHAGRGIAGALLAAGLDGLAARGCGRLKVTHDPANTAARRLYLGAGFRPHARIAIRTRPAAAQA